MSALRKGAELVAAALIALVLNGAWQKWAEKTSHRALITQTYSEAAVGKAYANMARESVMAGKVFLGRIQTGLAPDGRTPQMWA